MCIPYRKNRASQVALVVKNPSTIAGNIRGVGLISGSEGFPGGGQGNPFQYSCLENPMDRGVWWATVHRVAKSETWLKWLSTHALENYRLAFVGLGKPKVKDLPVFKFYYFNLFCLPVHVNNCWSIQDVRELRVLESWWQWNYGLKIWHSDLSSAFEMWF